MHIFIKCDSSYSNIWGWENLINSKQIINLVSAVFPTHLDENDSLTTFALTPHKNCNSDIYFHPSRVRFCQGLICIFHRHQCVRGESDNEIHEFGLICFFFRRNWIISYRVLYILSTCQISLHYFLLSFFFLIFSTRYLCDGQSVLSLCKIFMKRILIQKLSYLP